MMFKVLCIALWPVILLVVGIDYLQDKTRNLRPDIGTNNGQWKERCVECNKEIKDMFYFSREITTPKGSDWEVVCSACHSALKLHYDSMYGTGSLELLMNSVKTDVSLPFTHCPVSRTHGG